MTDHAASTIHPLGAARSPTGLIAKAGPLVAFGVLLAGAIYAITALVGDLETAPSAGGMIYLLLGLALLIALGFEFVNGFHDTANAVATVIYTHSMPAHVAVIWSGFFNFLGVLLSTGAVAFGIISLLPVELIPQVGSNAGFAMVFALLIAAIIWNLGTWYYGIPNSSSHALIGSIIGVGLMNQLMAGNRSGTSGVDWDQALGVGKSLLFSPLAGFFVAGLMLLLARFLLRIPALYKPPVGKEPPPWWIRGLLVFTCTGVSFAHGSNDGQKGMGLIMLILVGTVPMAYALNRALPADQVTQFVAVTQVTQQSLQKYTVPGALPPAAPRQVLTTYVRTHALAADVVPALAGLTGEIGAQVKAYGTLDRVPANSASNVRNDMYLAAESIRFLGKDASMKFDAETRDNLAAFKKQIDDATKFIPLWVKVAVAIALGLGTMVGWKRIVVTVGEKIGKSHLTYAQGASAELVAMLTIGAADIYGLPVSTTHVLSSGVAGSMAANRSGLQMATLRNLALAWVLTLPVAILLSGSLYWLFSHAF